MDACQIRDAHYPKLAVCPHGPTLLHVAILSRWEGRAAKRTFIHHNKNVEQAEMLVSTTWHPQHSEVDRKSWCHWGIYVSGQRINLFLAASTVCVGHKKMHPFNIQDHGRLLHSTQDLLVRRRAATCDPIFAHGWRHRHQPHHSPTPFF